VPEGVLVWVFAECARKKKRVEGLREQRASEEKKLWKKGQDLQYKAKNV